jgi:hypothetical protein
MHDAGAAALRATAATTVDASEPRNMAIAGLVMDRAAGIVASK